MDCAFKTRPQERVTHLSENEVLSIVPIKEDRTATAPPTVQYRQTKDAKSKISCIQRQG
ncbi:MAG: hypothetical protein RR624_04570 [Longicatena sp.]